jgi:hypothetical protein
MSGNDRLAMAILMVIARHGVIVWSRRSVSSMAVVWYSILVGEIRHTGSMSSNKRTMGRRRRRRR